MKERTVCKEGFEEMNTLSQTMLFTSEKTESSVTWIYATVLSSANQTSDAFGRMIRANFSATVRHHAQKAGRSGH